MKNASILIVEDEAIVALDLKMQLQEIGYRVVAVAADATQALAAVARHEPQLILMDVRLQGPIDGITAAQMIRERHDVPLIFLTSHSDDETVSRAARAAPYGYLTKPYQIKELRAGIEVALTKSRMERQLREADRWFAHTLQCVADGVVVTDLAQQVRFLNPAAEVMTGWTLEQASGRPIAEVVRWRACAAAQTAPVSVTQRVQQVLRDGRPSSVAHALTLTSRHGVERPVDETAGPVDDDGGQRLGAVIVLRDATSRLAQESLLRASEARFRSAFDFAPLGMALVSYRGDFIQVNDALCRLLGRTREALCRLNQRALTVEADREHETQRLHELAMAQASVVQFEKRYLTAAGAPLWVLVSVSQLHTGGEASCHLYQVHDLTEQKKAAEHLAALADERMRREASELANAAKSEFLSRASHEMRTPLNAVMGFAQLLQLQRLPPDADLVGQYAGHIHAAGQHLLALVNDLLDLNRAAQGHLKLQLAPTRLAPLIDETWHLLQLQASQHAVELAVELDPVLTVLADALRLRQVLVNLVSNAIKYNRQGGQVRIGAETQPDGQVLLRVEDQGIGMTPLQLERLYQPFDRLGAEQTKVPGTGLGLVISRSLVHEMGGTLEVRSSPNAGTTVCLRLPSA